jgi:hypothetical protein
LLNAAKVLKTNKKISPEMLDGLRAVRPKHHTPKPDYFGTARSILCNKMAHIIEINL